VEKDKNGCQREQIKILVLGGTGFIGGAITRYLLGRGGDVLAVSSKDCDLLDEAQTQSYFSSLQEDYVVVFTSGVVRQKDGGRHILYKNINMVKNFCEAVDPTRIKSVIYLSTCDVYGRPPEIITEQTLPHPTNYYGIGKLTGEYLLEAAMTNVPVTILRLPGIYGGNNRQNTIAVLLDQLRQKGHVRVYGDGSDRRDYVYVEDVCRVVETFIGTPYKGVVNVATGQSLTINEIIHILGRLLNQPPEIEYVHREQAGPQDLVFDNRLLTSLMPKDFSFTPLEEGAKIYIYIEAE